MRTIKDIGNEHYFDFEQQSAFCHGANEAQRWIKVTEELPEETGWDKAPYIARSKKEDHIVGYTKGHFHLKGGLCLKPGWVIEWRPIERR